MKQSTKCIHYNDNYKWNLLPYLKVRFPRVDFLKINCMLFKGIAQWHKKINVRE